MITLQEGEVVAIGTVQYRVAKGTFRRVHGEAKDGEALSVAELLAGSRAAHLTYRQHAGRVDKDGKVTVPYQEDPAVDAVTKARDLRQRAHDLDPTHTDTAWRADQAPHDALMQFYAGFLK